MFRLVRLTRESGTATVYIDNDGFTSRAAAWAAYSREPLRASGVGRFDADGKLVEIALHARCHTAQILDLDCLDCDTVTADLRLAYELSIPARTIAILP